MSARKMPFREVDGVRELHYLPQKVRSGPEALDDSRNLLSTGTRPPEVISGSGVARCFAIFDDPDFGAGF